MKRNLFKTIIILIAVIFVSLQSCEKKELLDENNKEVITELTYADMPELEVKNGMLYFDSEDEFFQAVSIIPNMTKNELNDWESKLGFTSIRTIQNEFYQILDNFDEESTSSVDILNLVEEFSDYFEIITDENGEDLIVEKIEDIVYSSICNNNSMFLTFERANKIINNYQISSPISQINELLLTNDVYNTEFPKTQYSLGNNDKAYQQYDAEFAKNPSGCRNDRKVKITMRTLPYSYFSYVTYGYVYVWDVIVWVKPYTKLACIWRNYSNHVVLRMYMVKY